MSAEIVFEHSGARYSATIGEPISEDDLARAALAVEGTVAHSSARYAVFVDVREPGGYIARPVIAR